MHGPFTKLQQLLRVLEVESNKQLLDLLEVISLKGSSFQYSFLSFSGFTQYNSLHNIINNFKYILLAI